MRFPPDDCPAPDHKESYSWRKTPGCLHHRAENSSLSPLSVDLCDYLVEGGAVCAQGFYGFAPYLCKLLLEGVFGLAKPGTYAALNVCGLIAGRGSGVLEETCKEFV